MLDKQKSIVIAGIFGNALEWYDFTVYAFFVPVLAKLFFPAENSFISLLQTFGVFAIGFLIRPVGAVLFGYLGDHIGRRKALILSIMLMSVPTFLLGLLPVYQQVGVLAPILLTALRLLQGLAVSGELTTATSFLVEHAPPHRRGFAGSLAMCSAFIGIALSSAIASLVTELVDDQQLYAWGFRIPFLIGGFIGVIGLMIRLKTIEPEIYQRIQEGKVSESLPSLWSHLSSLNYGTIIIGILITAIMAIGNYFLIAYFNTFLVESQHFPLRQAMLINFLSLLWMTLLMPTMGILSDYLGRKMVLGAGIVGFILLSYPIFLLLTASNIWLVFCGELLFATTLAPISGVIPTTLAELFDTYHRNTGLSISYNFSLAIFGGTAPLAAMTLVAMTQSVFAPAFYIMGAAIIGLILLFTFPESYKKSL